MKNRVSVTIKFESSNNFAMTIQASSHHHPTSHHLRTSHEAFNYIRQAEEGNAGGSGHHRAPCTLATDLKASNHIDLLPTWLTRCTPRRARKSFLRALSHTHHTSCRMLFVVCMTKTALPSPCVPSPQTFFFQANSNFCLRKKNYAHQPHTLPLCKKKPSQVFLATRHQGCVLLKWYFDRQCNTYFTQRFLYNCPRLVLF